MIVGPLAAFVLFFREGIEASLIVSMLLAATRQTGLSRQARSIWIGVGGALFASLVGGVVVYATIRAYDGSMFQTVFETVTYLLAVVLLTATTFWMQAHSRTLRKDLAASMSMAAGSAFALGALAFSTVGREGLETVVFALALALQTSGWQIWPGILAGLAAALALSWLIYHLGYRLNYRLFFRVLGMLLLLFAAGLLSDAVQNVQELGLLHVGTQPLWDTTGMLPEDGMVGDLLHTFLGYAQSPSALQVLVYVGFLSLTGTLFWRKTRQPTASAVTPERTPRSAGACLENGVDSSPGSRSVVSNAS